VPFGQYCNLVGAVEPPVEYGTHKIMTRKYSAVKRSIWSTDYLPRLVPATILSPNIVKLRESGKPSWSCSRRNAKPSTGLFFFQMSSQGFHLSSALSMPRSTLRLANISSLNNRVTSFCICPQAEEFSQRPSSTIQKPTTNDLSSLKTEDGTLRTTYGIRSVGAMGGFQNGQGSSSEVNAGLFGVLLEELRDRTYQCTSVQIVLIGKSSFGRTGHHRPPLAPPTGTIQYRNTLPPFLGHGDCYSIYIALGKKKQSLVFLLDLQLSCSYLHDDVTKFLLDHNEFYFACPGSLEYCLLCLDPGGGPSMPMRTATSAPSYPISAGITRSLLRDWLG
jgi:hypothetical protein